MKALLELAYETEELVVDIESNERYGIGSQLTARLVDPKINQITIEKESVTDDSVLRLVATVEYSRIILKPNH